MRGNKILSIALTLALVLSMLAFVGPVHAQGSMISVPTIDNPFMAPGGTFTIDILVNNVVDLWGFDIILNYNKDILTPVPPLIINPTDPVAGKCFKVITAQTIDDSTGTIHFAADRGPSGNIVGEFLGIGNGVNRIFWLANYRILSKATTKIYVNGVSIGTAFSLTTSSGKVTTTVAPPAGAIVTADYVHPGLTVDANFPVGSITFSIDARGQSPLDLDSTVLTDIYMNPIAHDPIDGSFDDSYHGHIAAPLMKDDALMPESEFDVVITADNVRTPTWGISFFLDYNTEVLTALPGTYNTYIDDIAGTTYVQIGGLSLVTVAPVPLVTVRFKVDAEGWSLLDIRDVAAVSIYGDLLVFDSTDGSFASINVIDLSGKAAWPDTHQAKYGTIDMLNARVTTNSTGDPVTFQVVFSIYDSEGGFLMGTIMTAPMTIPEMTTVEVTAPFDTTLYGIPRYKVWIGAQVAYDSNGDGIMDSLGLRLKAIPIMVKA